MKKFNFNLRAFALAVATLFAATGCSDDDAAEEGGGGTTTHSIQIAVSDIQGTSAVVAATPSSTALTYIVDVVAKSDFDGYASPEAFAAAEVEAIKAEALAAESTLAEYLVSEGILNSGAKSEKIDGLTTSTDYVAFAYGLSMEGEITTAVAASPFTTLEKDADPDVVTFAIETSNVTATSVAAKVTPSDNTVTYYWNILPTETVESMSEADLVAALNQLYENYGITLYDVCETGASEANLTDLDPGTEYVLFAFTYTEDGEAGEFTTQKVSTLDASIIVEMIPGVYDETTDGYVNSDTFMSVRIQLAAKENPITSLYYYCGTTAEVESWIEVYDGAENFMADVATIPQFSMESMLEDMNTLGGLEVSLNNCIPETDYTILLLATDSKGVTSIYRADKATEAAKEASEAYKAWLGTWTVTSAKSLAYTQGAGFSETDTPMSFDITIKAQKLNATYEISGWGVTEDRVALPCVASFSNSDGTFAIANDQILERYSNGNTVVMSVCKYSGGYTFVGGDYDALTAEIGSNGTATVTGYEGMLEGGLSFNVVACDYFFDDGQKLYFLDNADGSEQIAYPMLPFTLTKKAAPEAKSTTCSAPAASSLRQSVKAAKAIAPVGMKEAAVRTNDKVQRTSIEMPLAGDALDQLKPQAGTTEPTGKKKLAALLLK